MGKPDEEPEPSNTPNKDMEDDGFQGVKTLKTWRDLPPTHYILKIESFSSLVRILKGTNLDNYISNVFNASDYDWRLVLYPWGDKKRNESDHISLYLKMEDPMGINAIIIFFVYDQLKDKYLSIQDMRVMQFNGKEEERGLSQLVPLNCFKCASNGFLINDSCVFGVEVFVIRESEGIEQCFRTLSEPSQNVYIWSVEKLSELKETGHFSEPFHVGDFQWKLHLYPRGVPKAKDKFLSIYLCLHDDPQPPSGSRQKMQDDAKFPSRFGPNMQDDFGFPFGYDFKPPSGSGHNMQDGSQLLPGQKMYVEFKLSILNQVPEKKPDKLSKRGNEWFSAMDNAWGFPYFTNLEDLGGKKGFIVRDALRIELQIKSMSLATPKKIDEPSHRPGPFGDDDIYEF